MTLVVILCLVLLVLGLLLMLAWNRLGGSMAGERLERAEQSANYRDGKFQNPIPTDNSFGLGKLWRTARLYAGGQQKTPLTPPPIVPLTPDAFNPPPVSGLRITWLGHSSALIEIDGLNILLDPVFSDRISPLTFAGPKRFHPVPISAAGLPKLDAVIISHDHFDHLDYDSILALAPKTDAFYMPLGVGAHLEKWKIPPEKIIEMDWWDEINIKDNLRLIACPARHFSGRLSFSNPTLWASWALIGPKNRVFFSGDTGIMPLFKDIGDRFGPFDATLIKIGAYGLTWPDIHINPEQGLKVHRMVKGRLMIPVHWGTFSLSYHAWTEPVERLLVAADQMNIKIAVPQPGQSLEPENPPPVKRWWPEIEWQPAQK